VAFYVATKDRWNWKKLLLWPLVALLAFGVVSGGGFYVYHTLQNRPKAPQEFFGCPAPLAERDKILIAANDVSKQTYNNAMAAQGQAAARRRIQQGDWSRRKSIWVGGPKSTHDDRRHSDI